MGRRCRAQPVPWSPSSAHSAPSSARTGEPTTHLASGPVGPARWQVMRVVWCLEPLRRSSLAAQRAGWAGRAAVTCSPFFTLMLGRTSRCRSSRRVPRRGRGPAGSHGAKPPVGRPRVQVQLLSSPSPSRKDAASAQVSHVALPPQDHARPLWPQVTAKPGIQGSQGLVQCHLQRDSSITLLSLHPELFPTHTTPPARASSPPVPPRRGSGWPSARPPLLSSPAPPPGLQQLRCHVLQAAPPLAG